MDRMLPADQNDITVEEAYMHCIRANKWEYLGVQFEHWLSGGFTAREFANALALMLGGKRDSHVPLVEDRSNRGERTEQYEDALVSYEECR